MQQRLNLRFLSELVFETSAIFCNFENCTRLCDPGLYLLIIMYYKNLFRVMFINKIAFFPDNEEKKVYFIIFRNNCISIYSSRPIAGLDDILRKRSSLQQRRACQGIFLAGWSC